MLPGKIPIPPLPTLERRQLKLVIAGLVVGIPLTALGIAYAADRLDPGNDLSYVEVLGGVAAFAAFLIFQAWFEAQTIRATQPSPRAKRIQELTKAFDDATALVDELRSEITEGHLLAERYKADVEQYERLAQLKSAEVEAITRVLKGELRSGERRSILWGLVSNALVGVVFFLLGLTFGGA